ncbi:integrase domain-containing protein [Methylohalomonas lacus]|nr:integrase domain-containing protein [Methylohalomonas lacus]
MATTLQDEMNRMALKTGGSENTKDGRMQTYSLFVDWCILENIQLKHIWHIKNRHVLKYVQFRLSLGISPRTLKNEMSHLRSVTNRITLTNDQLGIPRGSRKGVRMPPSEDYIMECLQRLNRIEFQVAVLLQRLLGLRSKEVIMIGPAIKALLIELRKWYLVNITRGTKGGKSRNVDIHEYEAIRDLLLLAQELVNKNGGQLIPAKSLKAAQSKYLKAAARAGLKHEHAPHSLRYSFAVHAIETYKDIGFDEDEALARTALSLGHGAGRTRFVKSVYARHPVEPSVNGITPMDLVACVMESNSNWGSNTRHAPGYVQDTAQPQP